MVEAYVRTDEPGGRSEMRQHSKKRERADRRESVKINETNPHNTVAPRLVFTV